jgi:hypothetical protein
MWSAQVNGHYFWLIFFVTVAEFCSTTRCAEAFGAFFLGFFTSRRCESLFPIPPILPHFAKDASVTPKTPTQKPSPSLYLRPYPGNMPRITVARQVACIIQMGHPL